MKNFGKPLRLGRKKINLVSSEEENYEKRGMLNNISDARHSRLSIAIVLYFFLVYTGPKQLKHQASDDAG